MIIRPYVLAWWTLLGIYGCAALLALAVAAAQPAWPKLSR